MNWAFPTEDRGEDRGEDWGLGGVYTMRRNAGVGVRLDMGAVEPPEVGLSCRS